MSEWRECHIGDLGLVVGGGTPTRERADYWGGPIPWLTPREITGNGNKWVFETQDCISESGLVSSGARLIPKGSLLITSRATIGFCALASRPITTNQGFKNLIPGTKVNSSYLFHLGRTLGREMTRRASGTTFLEISGGEFRRIAVRLPPLEEQRRIVEVLDTIDETIRATERVIAKLRSVQEGLAQRLLPEGGLVHETANRKLPEGWRFMTLDEIAVNHDGRRVPIRAEDRRARSGPYPYYGASGVIDHIDDYLFDGTYVLLGEDGENVLSRSNPLAFVVTGKIWVNNHAHVFEARAGVDSRFLAWVLERTDFSGIATGSAQPKITQLGLRQMRFPVPPYEEQTKVCNVLESISNCIAGAINHNGGVEAVRAGLAMDLLSGRVRTVAA